MLTRSNESLDVLERLLDGRGNAWRFLRAAAADRIANGGPKQDRRDVRALTRAFRVCTHEPDLFRTIEYAYAFGRMKRSKARRWLDVGCGDTPFSAFALASGAARTSVLVDVDDEALEAQARNMSAIGVRQGRFRLVKEDLRDRRILPDFSARIEGALLVSTIEHMQGDADVRFMERLWELLPDGAPAIVTVPALHSYEENVSGHYHGFFERRYDLRAFFARLQVNGFAADDVRFIVHRKGRARRVVESVLPSVNELFARWYGSAMSVSARRLLSPLLASALLDVSPAPDPTMIGIMATFRRTEKNVRDSVRDFADADPVIALSRPAEPPAGIGLYCPSKHIVCDWADRIVVPLAMTNASDETIHAGPIRHGHLHLGAHMSSVLTDESEWDYAHMPLPRDLPPRSTVLVPVSIPAPEGLCDFEFTIDICKEGFWWQGDVALEPAKVRVTLRERKA